MDDGLAQEALTGVVLGRHLETIEIDTQGLPVFSIASGQVGSTASEGLLQEFVQPLLKKRSLSYKSLSGQLFSSLAEMDGCAKQRLHVSRPSQSGPLIDYSLQGIWCDKHGRQTLVGAFNGAF